MTTDLTDTSHEFETTCRNNKINYCIISQSPTEKIYKILTDKDIKNIIHHISNFIKNKNINLICGERLMNYNDLKNNNFKIDSSLIKFELKPLQEETMTTLNDDIIKWPGNTHSRRQAAFPSSFRKLKTRDTYLTSKSSKKKKTKKTKSKKKQSLEENISFKERLLSSINETIGLSMVEPEILMVRSTHGNDTSLDIDSILESHLQILSNMLEEYLSFLESSQDEYEQAILDNLISITTAQINKLNLLIAERNKL